MRNYLKIIAATLWLFSATTVAQDDTANSELQSLMDAHWAYTLQEHPTLATAAGVNDYNHLLPQVSPLDQNRRLAAEQRFIQQLRQIDRGQLSADNQINYDLLDWVLETSIEDMQLNAQRIPFNTFSSFFID